MTEPKSIFVVRRFIAGDLTRDWLDKAFFSEEAATHFVKLAYAAQELRGLYYDYDIEKVELV